MNKIKIENVYLMISLLFGVLFVFILPPFQSPDEDSHFKKSYSISTGNFYAKDNGEMYGNYFPKNMQDYINNKKSWASNRKMKYSYDEFVTETQVNGLSEEKDFSNYSTVFINPFVYFIPAIGMILTKIYSFACGIPITVANLLYGARIICVLCYSLIIYYAIKTAPRFKHFIFSLALMPMTLSIISTINYDALLISCTFLLLSIVLKYKYDNTAKKISVADFILIGFITCVYISVKYIYIFNLLFLLLINKDKFGKKPKEKIKNVIYLILFAGALYLLFNYGNIIFDKTTHVSSDSIYANEQIKFVIHHPFKYCKIFIKTLIEGRYFYYTTFIGRLGLIDTFLPNIVYIIYTLLLLFSLFQDGNEIKKTDVKSRLFSLIIPIAIISLVFLGLYIYWTSDINEYGVGAEYITGVQGRYFIPAVIMICFLFVNNFKVISKYRKVTSSICIYSTILVLIITATTILLRFWV